MSQEQNENHSWTETISVTGEELLGTVKGLLNEVGVRRIVVRKKNGDVLVDVPLYLGLAGLLIFRFWAIVPVAAGLLADYSVEVTREGKQGKGENAEVKVEEPSPPTESTTPSEPQPPASPDDLTKINGIGPKVAGLLNESGITTFAQLAATSVANLQAILDKAGARYRIIDPTTWPEQAQQMIN